MKRIPIVRIPTIRSVINSIVLLLKGLVVVLDPQTNNVEVLRVLPISFDLAAAVHLVCI